MPLIDVGPENLKEMQPVARKHKNAEKRRATAVSDKSEACAEMVELVKKANLFPNEKGLIEFVVDGLRVKVTPDQWTVSVVETQ
jgi:hypothetical protein